MSKYLGLLLIFLSTFVLAQEPNAGNSATICLYRPHRMQGAALKPSVYVDEIEITRLHNGDAVQVKVSSGPHKVYSNDKSTGIELDAKAGETYFARIDIVIGAWKGHGQITLVDQQQGKFEFAKQKLSETRDLTTSVRVSNRTSESATSAAPPPAVSKFTSKRARHSECRDSTLARRKRDDIHNNNSNNRRYLCRWRVRREFSSNFEARCRKTFH